MLKTKPTYYDILNISPKAISSLDDPSPLIKRAYRRALLTHHPDKAKQLPVSPSNQRNPGTTVVYTIDQITVAYTTLSTPSLRAAYDRSLLTAHNGEEGSHSQHQGADFQTGIETVDLDDLDYSEAEARWYRSCRCGNPKGYAFTEADLEESADLGDLLVGCEDCSLWIRVQFSVIEEEEGDLAGRKSHGQGE
jgi:DnaJ-class molecular chaperone with C-terminal Zn finger domain